MAGFHETFGGWLTGLDCESSAGAGAQGVTDASVLEHAKMQTQWNKACLLWLVWDFSQGCVSSLKSQMFPRNREGLRNISNVLHDHNAFRTSRAPKLPVPSDFQTPRPWAQSDLLQLLHGLILAPPWIPCKKNLRRTASSTPSSTGTALANLGKNW